MGEDSERNEFYASKGLYGRVTVKGDLDAVNGARLITLLSSLSAPIPEKDGVKDTPYSGAAACGRVLRTTAAVRAGGVGSDRRRGETAHHGHRVRERHDGSAGFERPPAVDGGTRVCVGGLGGSDQYRYRADVGVRLHRDADFVG